MDVTTAMMSATTASTVTTVSLIRGLTEVEMSPVQLTCQSLSRVFGIDPESVWLKEEFGSRALLPEDDGSFCTVPMNGSLRVEGVPLENQVHRPLSQTVVSSASAPVPAFRSVTARQQQGGQSVSVKVIQFRLSFTDAGKPIFEKVGQVFVEVGEATANVPHIQSVVKAEFGANYQLVTNDGLELHDNTGTQGLKFWKAPNRRIFAVPESDLAEPSIQSKCKCKRVEQLPPVLYIEDALVPLTEKVETLVNDMNSIKGQLIQVFKVTKRAKIPPLLKQSIDTTFQCKICRNVMAPPVIFSKCCRSLLGCVTCVDEWYGGANALMKNCPNCSTERGYAETVRMAGIDDFLEAIQPIYDSDSDT